MWNWLFGRRRKEIAAHEQDAGARWPELEAGDGYAPLADLRADPLEGEEFDADRCQDLIRTLIANGAVTIDDAFGMAVTLEDFFEGNRSVGSFAANVVPPPPCDSLAGRYELLRNVRELPEVQDVLVVITDIEPYEDGRLGTWPYSDSLWIYSSYSRERIAELVGPLDPDEVVDYEAPDGRDLTLPRPIPAGSKAYWIWWD